MNTINQFVDPLVAKLGEFMPALVGAIVVLVIGLLAAAFLRRAVATFLRKLKIDERIRGKVGGDIRAEGFVAGLVYYVILVYVLLLTLGVLGIQGVLDPLKVMFTVFLGMLPNILAAILLGCLGYVLAKMIADVVAALSRSLDGLRGKLGLPEGFAPSKLLGQITFIVIFAPILIAALEALKVEAISRPAVDMLNMLMAAIPQILAAALILAVAYVVGRFVTTFLASLLQNLGADDLPAKIGAERLFGNTSLSRFTGGVVFFFIMLGASVSAAGKLGFVQIADILSNLLVFAGNVVLGLAILGIGNWIAKMAYEALSKSSGSGTMASIARVAIMGLVLAMGLRAMGIAQDIVNLAFLLSLGSVAVAVALSFGLGGREAAGRQMEHWLSKLREDHS